MTWSHPSTHPTTHPQNHTPTHGWGILQKFQIFKRNWNILISSSVTEFLLILGIHPLGVADGWMGVRMGMGVWGCPMHTHTHTCMHARTHMHVEHDKHAKHGCLHVSGHLQFYTCVCMCVCVHVHACGDTPMPPDAPRHPPPTCHLPRATGSPKHQNSISLELIKIFRFCLKILYLWTFLNSYRL